MNRIEELKVKEEDLRKQVSEFNAQQREVYEEFLKEKGLDGDVELKVWYRNKEQIKKGRILICSGYRIIGKYEFKFYPYTKKGELSLNSVGYISTPESILKRYEEGTLRAVKEVV